MKEAESVASRSPLRPSPPSVSPAQCCFHHLLETPLLSTRLSSRSTKQIVQIATHASLTLRTLGSRKCSFATASEVNKRSNSSLGSVRPLLLPLPFFPFEGLSHIRCSYSQTERSKIVPLRRCGVVKRATDKRRGRKARSSPARLSISFSFFSTVGWWPTPRRSNQNSVQQGMWLARMFEGGRYDSAQER